MLVKLKSGLANHWPLIPLAISVGALGTGVGLGAAGQAMIAVGSSNLPMVLALFGSSLAILTAFPCTFMYVQDNGKKHLIMLLLSAGLGAIVIGLGYAAVHFGIAQVLPSSLSVAESLGAQAGIGFGIGFVTVFGVGLLLNADKIKENLHRILPCSLAVAISVAASAAVGPALVHAIGAAAADSAQSMALESVISVGLALSSLALVIGMLDGAEYIKEECGKLS